jgi:hypothetical protein
MDRSLLNDIKTRTQEERVSLDELVKPASINIVKFISTSIKSDGIYKYEKYDGTIGFVESLEWVDINSNPTQPLSKNIYNNTPDNKEYPLSYSWSNTPCSVIKYNLTDRKSYFEYLFTSAINNNKTVESTMLILNKLEDYEDENFMIDLFCSYNKVYNVTVDYDKLVTNHPILILYSSYTAYLTINEYILHRKLCYREIMDLIIIFASNTICCGESESEYMHIMEYINETVENMTCNNYTENELDAIIKIVGDIHSVCTPGNIQPGVHFLEKINCIFYHQIMEFSNKKIIDNIISLAIELTNVDTLNRYKTHIKFSDLVTSNTIKSQLFFGGIMLNSPFYKYLFAERIINITCDDFIKLFKDTTSRHLGITRLLFDMLVIYCQVDDISQIVMINDQRISDIVSATIKNNICSLDIVTNIDVPTLKILCPDVFSSFYPQLIQYYWAQKSDPNINKEIEDNVLTQVIDNYKVIETIIGFSRTDRYASTLFKIAYNNVYQSETYANIFKQKFAMRVLNTITSKIRYITGNVSNVVPPNENVQYLIQLVEHCCPSNQVHLRNYYLSYVLNIDIDKVRIDDNYIVTDVRVMDIHEFIFFPVLSMIHTNNFTKQSYIIDSHIFSDATYKLLLEISVNNHLFLTKIVCKIMDDNSGINKDIIVNNRIVKSAFAANLEIAKQIKRIFVE